MVKATVYDYGDTAAPSFPTTFTVIRKDVLQCTSLDGNHNKYYVLELHVAADSAARVFTEYGRTDEIGKKPGKRECRHPGDRVAVEALYERLLREKTIRKKDPYRRVDLVATRVGTSAASAGVVDPATLARARPAAAAPAPAPAPTPLLEPRLRDLVVRLYQEATGKLTTTVQVTITAKGLETPLGVLTLAQVKRGEDLLKSIAELLERGASSRHDDLVQASSEFYSAVPHKLGARHQRQAVAAAVIDTLEKVAEKQQTLELMRDMLGVDSSVGGAGLLASDDLTAKYAALQCKVEPLEPGTALFEQIVQRVLTSQARRRGIKRVVNVARLHRSVEATYAHAAVMTTVGNILHGYHASKAARFVGILSRGLLPPKIAVASGISRTDGGWLGAGIYFGAAADTAANYSSPNAARTRWMVLANVAMGYVFETTRRDFHLQTPPAGYNSCLGLRRRHDRPSEFDDSEMVIYHPAQARLAYLIEFEV
mgnify:CR=1 FL=1